MRDKESLKRTKYEEEVEETYIPLIPLIASTFPSLVSFPSFIQSEVKYVNSYHLQLFLSDTLEFSTSLTVCD